MNAGPATEFLRRHRWHARGTLLAWSLAAALAALVGFAGAWCGWWTEPLVPTMSAMAASAVLLGAWFLRAPALTRRHLARTLDQRWGLRARLESATELSGDQTPFAVQQRADAAQVIAGRTPPGLIAWLGGLGAVGVLVLLLVVESGVWFWHHRPVTSAAPVVAVAAASADETGQGMIDWKSPAPEIRATAIEEVPLTAVAESKAGFRALTLEVLVNGVQQVSHPLGSPIAEACRKPGAHDVEPSLYLDELPLKPFDIVAYRLVGELDTPGAPQVVRSAQQIIEIRGPRQDAVAVGKGASELLRLLMEMKTRQLQLLKQNSALGQLAGTAVTDPSWAAENDRVAGEQRALARRGDDALQLLAHQEAPPLLAANLSAAKAAMLAAAGEIGARRNEAAIPPQNRALALIAELDQFIEHAVVSQGLSASDPIPDDQSFRLAERVTTPAGRLEQLAKRQESINRPASASGGGATSGDRAPAQAAIARDTETLAADNAFVDEVRDALQAAAPAAADAAKQLAANDPDAARLPAAAAERSLKEAVEAQDKRGRALAVAALEQARRTLNAAARASGAGRQTSLRNARQALIAAANSQQQTGSAEAARELARIADALGNAASSKPRTGTADPASNDPLQGLLREAARVQVGLSEHTTALNRAIHLLARTDHLPGSGGSDREVLANIELASQEAQWLSPDPAVIQLARSVAGASNDSLRQTAAPEPKVTGLAVELAAQLEHGRPASQDDGLVRQFNPADVDPLYREAVQNYFERLSRNARAAAQAKAASAP